MYHTLLYLPAKQALLWTNATDPWSCALPQAVSAMGTPSLPVYRSWFFPNLLTSRSSAPSESSEAHHILAQCAYLTWFINNISFARAKLCWGSDWINKCSGISQAYLWMWWWGCLQRKLTEGEAPPWIGLWADFMDRIKIGKRGSCWALGFTFLVDPPTPSHPEI